MDATATTIVLALAVAWFLQLFLSYRQMRRFYQRMFRLRRDGRAAIGMEGNRLRGRVYGVLVVDGSDVIVHAEQLSGWTVLANLKPVPALVGQPLNVLFDDETAPPVPPQQWRAFRQAAQHLREAAAKAASRAAEEGALPSASAA